MRATLLRPLWLKRDEADLEPAHPLAAAGLSLAFGGGGQLFVGDWVRGALFIAVWLTLVFLEPFVLLPLFCISSAVHAGKEARQLNRYLAARDAPPGQQEESAYQLLHAMQAVGATSRFAHGRVHAPSVVDAASADAFAQSPANAVDPRFAELANRVRRVEELFRAGTMSEVDARERKIDILSDLAELDPDDLDAAMHALLPLAREGLLRQEDLEFLRALRG